MIHPPYVLFTFKIMQLHGLKLKQSNFSIDALVVEASSYFSPMFSPMDPIIFLLLLTSFFTCPLPLLARSTKPAARITVVGVVYCDSCSSNAFSRHSYFMPGVDVQIQCKFKANTPEATEQMNFSVNRTTNKYGVYKLDIPSVGVNCINGLALVSMCHASLLRSSSSACSVPALRTTSDEISIKSEQDNLCIYSLNAMSYRPSKKNTTLCANQKEELASSFNSSKSLFPFYPPYKYPLPPLSSLPFPPLLPSPSVPFPLPPFPLQSPPSLPFPFPPLPPFPPTPSLFQPPPPPAFSLTDPRTWFPNNPLYSPPPPPAFSLTDPRTWIPPIPPSPPSRIQDKNP